MSKIFRKIGNGFLYLFYLCLFGLFFVIGKIFCSKRQIWLVNERGYDARDNGYHFYKFLKKEHPEIESYFAIDKKSSDFKNVKDFPNVVQQGSIKHIFLFSIAKFKISTQVFGYAPNRFYIKLMSRHHLQGYNIGLKHGIFKNIHPNYFKSNSKLDLIICGAKPEYDFVKEKFNFNERQVVYTGLARFDNLQTNCSEKQILLMPTFRIPLVGLTNEDFLKTDFYNKWIEIISKIDNSELIGYKVVFYLHAKFQKFYSLFLNEFKFVEIATFQDYDVQQLLRQSSVLITDFSSIFFDFAYMRKPSIYFQFDEDYYYKNHYEKGYFDYRRDGFGKVCETSEKCILELEKILKKNCVLDNNFKEKIDNFFPIRDNKNCERIFNSILDLL